MPVSQRMAGALEALLRNVPVDHPAPPAMPIHAVLRRWQIDPPRSESLGRRGDAFYLYLRSRLADRLPADEALRDHPDEACRGSFWRSFDPSLFLDWPEKFSSLFDADFEYALDCLGENPALWRTSAARAQLFSIFSSAPGQKHSLHYLNTFDALAERWRGKHPEWFEDSDWRSGQKSPEPEVPATEPIVQPPLSPPPPQPETARRSTPWWAWTILAVLIVLLLR